MAKGYKKSIVLGLDIGEFQDNAKKAKQEIEDIGEAGKSTGNDLEDASESTKVFSSGLNAVVDVADLFAAGMDIVGNAISAVIAEMKECLDVGTEYAAELTSLSENNGWSTNLAQEWEMIAAQTGTSVDTISNGFSSLADAMQKANAGDREAKTAFAELGVSIQDANGKLRSTQAVFNDAIDKINGVTESTKKAKLGSELFGNAYANLNAVIAKGSSGLKEIANTMTSFLTQEEIQALNDYSAAMGELQQNITFLKSAVGAELAQALIPVLEKINSLDFRTIANTITEVANALSMMGEIANNIANPLTIVKNKIQDIVDTAQAFIDLIKGDWKNAILEMSNVGIGGSIAQKILGNYVGHNASGTSAWRGGLTWVGEEGPELVNLPPGSSIYNNATSNSMASNTYNITMNCDLSQLKSVSDVVDAVNGLSNSRRGFA